MRVAALYDIHGNLPALEAVLTDVRREGADLVVVGGDVVPGPMPREVLDLLAALEVPTRFIYGNGERDVLAAAEGRELGHVPERFREAIRWVAAEVTPEQRSTMASWPGLTQVEESGLGDVLFCHATPTSDTEIFTRLTPEERLLPLFRGTGATTVICGHTHMQFDRRVGDVRVVNAGSVGMPFGEPGAYWLVLDDDAQLRRTGYDLEAAAERIRATPYPGAEEFASRYALNPPSEAEMLTAFGG